MWLLLHPLSPHGSPCLHRHEEGLPSKQACAPLATTSSAPSFPGGLMCSGAVSQPCGWPSHRGGAKITLGGHTTKEEELESLLVEVWTTDLTPHDWLCKLSALGTSECSHSWVSSSFSSYRLCGHICMVTGPDGSLSYLQSAQLGTRYMIYCNPGTWLPWICAGGLVKTPERHQDHLLAYSWLRWGWEQCQQQCALKAHTVGKRCHTRAHSPMSSSTGETFSGFPPSGSAPTLPTSDHRLEIH